MSQIVNTNTPGKTRTQLSKFTVMAIRELMKQKQFSENTKDLVAFIVLSLKAISDTIDPSVEAWEKRGYWIKADRFRMEWNWTGAISDELKNALLADDWALVAQLTGKVAEQLSNVKIPIRTKNNTPWVGAWNIMNQKK
ncbi:MAG: hypothetical protein ABFD51_02335 [Anaerolineaceae bacterium]